ncbi:polysaccharide pyruvyl transferase family protein [Cytobacillus oceanisediminis]|uniref:polysaccharide pyruvyl transferase family protein n=1 Tax=Cytobacillus oceanisediminis TaxID=665099 RepID=UPI0011A20791|nr:polysaccharide pyruvyl transferase family protein [Cytobacillus oceanisediminis]
MYIVLTGAKKNVGDFLIRDRSLKLLKHLKPTEEFKEFNSWEPLDEKLDIVNQSNGIIICGGPGYKQDMYPNVYPLTKNLDDIKVPIYILGAGWYGVTGDQEVMNNYKFTESAKALLNKAAQNNGLSCRDYFTKRVVEMNGINPINMTGCPVLYNLEYLNTGVRKPSEIKTIVFTTPQDPLYANQSIRLMESLKKEFPDAKIYASFHRGTGREEGTGLLEGIHLEKMAQEAERLGLEVMDTSSDLSKIDFYSETDLHIGYRVHAHLYFLSERKPSFLINEDGRGTGFCNLLNLSGINAYKSNSIGNASVKFQNKWIKKGINKSIGNFKAKNDISDEVISYMKEEIHNGFNRFNGIDEVIDGYYKNMKQFIESI